MKKTQTTSLIQIFMLFISANAYAGLETSGYDHVREVIKFEQPSSGFIYDASKNMLFEPIKKSILPSDVLFPFNSSMITTLGKAKIADFVRQSPENAYFTVIGHTDHIGSNSYNMSLGNSRAQSVTNAMISAGIPAQNISFSSAGESQPVTSGCGKNIQCLSPDRRVVIVTHIPYKEDFEKFKEEVKTETDNLFFEKIK